MKAYINALVLGLLVAGCSNTDSHLPNPLALPAQALNTGLNNAFYNARRNRVEDFVTANQSGIMTDVQRGGGNFLTQAMSISRVRPAQHPDLLAVLASDVALYLQDEEALVVALMVHADPRPVALPAR